jgi:hypothetical protein
VRPRTRQPDASRSIAVDAAPPVAHDSRHVLRYHLLLLVKYTGVLLFAGGAMASFIASDLEARKRAVHRQASLGLGLTWLSGFALAYTLGWTLTQLWLIAAVVTSILINGILSYTVGAPDRPKRGPAIAVAVLFVATLGVMIWKPTWKLVSL